jgi:hypothetical protein
METALQNEVDRHQKAMDRLVGEFSRRIEELPDNPLILRQSPNGLVAKFSDMSVNWAPSYHDFKLQYRFLSEMVQRNPEKAVNVVVEAVEKGSIRVGCGEGRYTINLHPQVLNHLRGLLGIESPEGSIGSGGRKP